MRSAADALLLRACLWEGEAARAAFAEWARQPTRALASLQQGAGLKRRLLPLLHASAERHRFDVLTELQPPMKAAAMYEQLRTRAYREIAADVLATLQASALPFLATRGIVFSASLYRDAELRHCHDIDLLVCGEDQAALADLLVRECGFTQREQAAVPPGSLLLYHASGLPLFLHTRPLTSPGLKLPFSLESATRLHTHGVDVPTLPPTLALLHLLLHGPLTPQGESLVWLCDAFKLLQQSAVEWSAFQEAIAGDTELLLARTGLHSLASDLQAAVPKDVLEALDRRWTDLTRATRSAAEEMVVLLLQRVVGRRNVLQSAYAWDLPRVLRTLVFPSPRALQSAGYIPKRTHAPVFWIKQAVRPLRRLWPRAQGNTSS